MPRRGLIFVTASANEWLLVLANGKLERAGIGLRVRRRFGRQIYTFPSSIQKVDFNCTQVTKQMQGIGVQGFVVWSINRERDGPLKAFRNLAGIDRGDLHDACESIRLMAESIIRSQVANASINEIISQRELLRDQTRKKMQEVVNGWGVWVETVELNEVRILSKALFEDMQAPYRQEMRLHAEEVKSKARRAIEHEKMDADLQLAKQRAETKKAQAVFESKQQLEEEQEEEKLFLEQQRIQRIRLENERQVQMLREENSSAVTARKMELDGDLERRQLELERDREASVQARDAARRETDMLEARHVLTKELEASQQRLHLLVGEFEAEKQASPATLQRQVVSAVRDLYKHIESVRVVNVQGGDPTGMESAVTRLAAIVAQSTQAIIDHPPRQHP